MFLLTLSNTFRNKGRVILTQIALVMSGLIFMMVISTRDSVVYMVNDVIFEILGSDITFLLERPERIDVLTDLLNAHPEVTGVEAVGVIQRHHPPAG